MCLNNSHFSQMQRTLSFQQNVWCRLARHQIRPERAFSWKLSEFQLLEQLLLSGALYLTPPGDIQSRTEQEQSVPLSYTPQPNQSNKKVIKALKTHLLSPYILHSQTQFVKNHCQPLSMFGLPPSPLVTFWFGFQSWAMEVFRENLIFIGPRLT